ncbi:MAG: trypsin-like peptidase domain-containing protein [Kofleriaceae bacterium]|nr:trypsin-like peptidase domain-containing protein [Kofleriaceae bacterium]
MRFLLHLSTTALLLSVVSGCEMHDSFDELNPDRLDIYGEDSRAEPYEFAETSVEFRAVQATAALVNFSGGAQPAGELRLYRGESLGREKSLCDGVRFEEQPVLSSCTGFLIGPDLLATAGHCVNESTCGNINIVFDYRLTSADDTSLDGEVLVFPADNVYTCIKVEAHDYVPGGSCSSDYAILRLDRPVTGRVPLQLSDATPSRGEAVFSVGHPSGLPTKVASDAIVRQSEGSTFRYELDLFAGNSGSPVLDAKGEVRGIHICGGQGDYTSDPAPWNPDFDLADGSCQVPTVCDEYCGSLGVAHDISALLPDIANLDTSL